jgi:hypothetical protein
MPTAAEVFDKVRQAGSPLCQRKVRHGDAEPSSRLSRARHDREVLCGLAWTAEVRSDGAKVDHAGIRHDRPPPVGSSCWSGKQSRSGKLSCNGATQYAVATPLGQPNRRCTDCSLVSTKMADPPLIRHLE